MDFSLLFSTLDLKEECGQTPPLLGEDAREAADKSNTSAARGNSYRYLLPLDSRPRLALGDFSRLVLLCFLREGVFVSVRLSALSG